MGNYVDATGQHGFLLDVQGNFTSITYPGGYNTIALGINDAGNIVGAYTGGEGSEFGDHGFLYAGGTFTSINYPGVSPYYVIEAHGINNAGYIVGFYNDNAPGDHGFLATPVPPPPGKVPSLNEWGSIILSLVLAAGAIWLLRKRQSIG